MDLEPEQVDLLIKFVEAHRSVPREARGAFVALDPFGDSETHFIHLHGGASFKGGRSDADILADYGLLRRGSSGGDVSFSVTPQGISAYQQLKTAAPPARAVEDSIRQFLDASEFQQAHKTASGKWDRAAKLLWSADSNEQMTTIGHLCREAMQEFSRSLAAEHRVDIAETTPQNTVQRLRKVLSAKQDRLGATAGKFIDALIAYWGTVSDLVQRQEHGGQREGEPLSLEDGRRVVFQTMLVMYEVSRALKR